MNRRPTGFRINTRDRVRWTMKGGVVRKKQGVSRTKVSETTMFLSEVVVLRGLSARGFSLRKMSPTRGAFFGQMWASVPTICNNAATAKYVLLSERHTGRSLQLTASGACGINATKHLCSEGSERRKSNKIFFLLPQKKGGVVRKK